MSSCSRAKRGTTLEKTRVSQSQLVWETTTSTPHATLSGCTTKRNPPRQATHEAMAHSPHHRHAVQHPAQRCHAPRGTATARFPIPPGLCDRPSRTGSPCAAAARLPKQAGPPPSTVPPTSSGHESLPHNTSSRLGPFKRQPPKRKTKEDESDDARTVPPFPAAPPPRRPPRHRRVDGSGKLSGSVPQAAPRQRHGRDRSGRGGGGAVRTRPGWAATHDPGVGEGEGGTGTQRPAAHTGMGGGSEGKGGAVREGVGRGERSGRAAETPIEAGAQRVSGRRKGE